MNKCSGCGAETSNKELCDRCFRIRHYNEYTSVDIKDLDFIEIIESIKPETLTLLVVDVLDLPEDFALFNNLQNVILVLTKRDLLPKSFNEEKILDYIDNYNYQFTDKIIVSSNKNYNLDQLMEMIELHKEGKEVYVVGMTNSGKSTLLNKIMYNYSEKFSELTTSMLPSTTLNTIAIEINDNLTLIDTPGVVDSGSINFHLSKETLKKLVLKKAIKPITYQIRAKQYIKIEDFLFLEFTRSNSVTLYLSNNLNVERLFDKPNIEFDSNILNMKFDDDIVIKGLGFINVKYPENVVVYVKEGIDVFKRDSIIK